MLKYPENPSPGNDPPPAPTVAEAIAIVASWDTLSIERRRGLTSSLRAIARIAESDPATLRLCPAELNAKVLGRAPQLYGLSATSMATVRSHVRYAMRRLGLLDTRPTLTPAWAELRRHLAPRVLMTLTRFLAYHSVAGVLPAEVSDETFERCQKWILTETLCRNPRRLFGQIRYVWNKVAREMPELGLPILGAARCQVRKTVALADLHPDMQADLALMAARLGSSDLDEDFDDADIGDVLGSGPVIDQAGHPAPRRALRPITIDERLRHARQAVWVAVQIGVPRNEIRGLRDLVVPLTRAKQIIRYLWDRAGKAPSASAGHVAEVLRQIAKFHVGLPKADVDQIAVWHRKVAPKYAEMTEKNRRRLEVLLTPAAEAKLLALPKVLMEEARELLPVSPVLAVSAAKRALLVHLELFYAFRVKNVCLLRRDRHLVLAAPGTPDAARFLIPEEELKNSKTFDRPVLSLTNAYIQEWERTFRPLIAAPGNPYLFPGEDNKPMCRQAIAASLKKIIVERVGCEVNIHLMRHRAAVAYLKIYPGEFGIVAELLGHKTEKTARKSYTGPERDAAFERFDHTVLDAMKSLKRASAPKHRRPRAGRSLLVNDGPASPRTSRGHKHAPSPASSRRSSVQRTATGGVPPSPGATRSNARKKGAAE
ncbi:tyrosine-type recombinase/integrase [Acidiphilium sp. JA12-A1]|uniref:tyrosine-type recombinase/integrase n=1 Tax=Acidiphilium sp. JA12-A1 TaxID=1464546 RepID=UPI000461352D|nr:tyrosine-type recombinase/integrase [Acidiphilium sp. JA12-A1]KDM66816.1 phage integrase family protein [Acidiphilium sp. JA12-A1]